MQFKAPGELINGQFHAPDLFMVPVAKRHAVVEHGNQQCLCGMGAEDLALEPGIYEIRYPADVINVGMGQKQVINIFGLNRELIKGKLRVVALGHAAVHQDVYALFGIRLGLHQMAGTGDARFCSKMCYFHGVWPS